MMNGVVPNSAAVYDYMTDLKLTQSLVNKTTSNVRFNYIISQQTLKGPCIPKFVATDMFCFMFRFKEVYILILSTLEHHHQTAETTACTKG